MHARVVTGQFQPGKLDEAIKIYRDSVMPISKEQKGFNGAFFLTNSNTNKTVSITLWETVADMTEGESSGYYREQFAKFTHILAEQPDLELFDLSVLM